MQHGGIAWGIFIKTRMAGRSGKQTKSQLVSNEEFEQEMYAQEFCSKGGETH